MRLGVDDLVGLVPAIGDAVTGALAAYIVCEAWRLGTPGWTLARMLGNLDIDFLVGIVPVAGDLLDMGFKANRRNLRLLHRHLSAHAGLDTGAATRTAPRVAQVAGTSAGSSSRTRRPPVGDSSSETLPP